MINYVLLNWNRKLFMTQFFKSFYENIGSQEFNFYIIDNGSTDGCAEFLKDLSEKDKRIKLTLNKENKGLNEYKKLFKQALKDHKTKFIVMCDNDIISFPPNFDLKMVNGMTEFKEIGYLALDVVQNEKTNGAKPTADNYVLETRKKIALEFGPAGAWFSMVRANDLRKVIFFVNLFSFSMKRSHDTVVGFFLRKILRKRTGILAGEKCFHATGPYYATKFGSLQQDIQKYDQVGLNELRDIYKNYKN